jgi:peptidoglycan DL-endopeptidase CwlO
MRVRAVVGAAFMACAVGGVATPVAGAASGGASAPTGTQTTSTSTTTSVSATQTVTLTHAQMKAVQRKLGVHADGMLGPKSRSALKGYQKRKKLKVTGKPDLQTLRAMHLSFAETIAQKLATKSAPSTTSSPATGPSAKALNALNAALDQIGTPYKSGGTKPGGFDCSGLVMWAFAQVGVHLPRTSFDQFDIGKHISRKDIQAGDLVFFATDGPGASHVGIAISATTAVSSTSHGVRKHEIFDDYWGAAYVGARRVK